MKIETVVKEIGNRLQQKVWMLSVAESCTGGLVAHTLTNTSGSSKWFSGGVIAYSNEVKNRVLGVHKDIIEKHGAVSKQSVLAMVRGACGLTNSQVGLAISGIAGPTGGTPEKPVGTVWIAWDVNGKQESEKVLFMGSRDKIKQQAMEHSLIKLGDLLQREQP